MRSLSLRDTALVGVSALVPSLWLPAGGVYYQDSALTTLATADSDPVGGWINQGGSGSHGLQATSGSRALLRTGANGLNGLPVLQFDGTDDWLAANIPSSPSGQTLFCVAKKRSAASATQQVAIAMNLSTGSNPWVGTSTAVGTGYDFRQNQAGSVVSIGGTVTNWNIIAVTWVTTSIGKVRVGGGAGIGYDPDDGYLNGIQMILGGNGIFNPGDYNIAEAIHYLYPMTFAELDVVGNYLATKFALPWTAAA